MHIYLLALAISCVFCALSVRYKGTESIALWNSKIKVNMAIVFWLLSSIPLTLVAAIRNISVGTDLKGTYLPIFNIIKDDTIGIRDYGYAVINKIVLFFSTDFQGVVIVTSILICGLIYLAIYQQSKNKMVSILLFVVTCEYFISLNMIRQTIATAIFIYAIKYIEKKDWKRYFLCIIIATTFHTSAIIYFALYFYDIAFRYIKQICIGLAALVVLQYPVVMLLKYILSHISYTKTYFIWYFDSMYNSGKLNVWSLAVQVSVLVLVLIMYKYGKDKFQYQFFLIIQLLSVLILSYSSFLPLAQRISYLFTFSNIIFLPGVIESMPEKKKKIAMYALLLICFFGYMWITIVMRGHNEVLPYKTCF